MNSGNAADEPRETETGTKGKSFIDVENLNHYHHHQPPPQTIIDVFNAKR
jgi:hypothetical protein